MRKEPIVVFLFILWSFLFGQDQDTQKRKTSAETLKTPKPIVDTLKTKPETTDTLKGKRPYEIGEEVIRGERPYLIEEKKLFVVPPLNPFFLIEERIKPTSYIYDERLYYSVDSLTIPSLFISANYLRVPVKRKFIYGNVLVLFPQFEKTVAHWRLVIYDGSGSVVKQAKGEGMPPGTIVWDGRKDNGEIIAPGEVYSFAFYAYDALGNETEILGEARKISGLFYEEKGKKVISISAREIFKETSSELTPQAFEILDEAANLIKENFKREITVFVYSPKEEILSFWCQSIERELKKRILLPKGTISVAPRFLPGGQPKYSKIDIFIN